VIGQLTGAYFSAGATAGFTVISTAVARGAAGALSGLAAERSPNTALPISVGAVVGALGWYWIGRAGMPGKAALTGAVVGAVVGVIVALKGGRRLAA
jgi:hypothetical protein